MTIEMLDAADSRGLLDGFAYAAYADGEIGDQPNAARVKARFPGAHVLTIALSTEHDADCLDVEPFAASPSDVPGWHARQLARGIARPVIYASVDLMRDQVLPLLNGKPRRLWTAHYGLGKHICGPRSCGELPVDADGTQWSATMQGANGITIDISLLSDTFFGATAPANLTEELMQELPALLMGSSGERVKSVQGLCVARGHAIAVDGKFGVQTHDAVMAVQKAAGFSAAQQDGIVGPLTWPVLLGIA